MGGGPVSPFSSGEEQGGPPSAIGADFVSVIIPAYNAGSTIAETLHSVRNQSHDHLEIIVVDDGSSDRTVEIVASHAAADDRIRLIRQANGGVAAARNRGVDAARGELLAFIDADDLWLPTKLERQLRVLKAGGEQVALVYCWSALIDGDGRLVSGGDFPPYDGDVLAQLCHGNFVGNGSSALIRKSAFFEGGGFDPSLRAQQAQGCEDWRLYLNLAERNLFGLVRDRLTGYRQVAGAMSGDVGQMLRSDALVRGEMLLRRPEYRYQLAVGRRNYIDWLLNRELACRNWDNCRLLIGERLGGQRGGRALLGLVRLTMRMAKRSILARRRSSGPYFIPRVPAFEATEMATASSGPGHEHAARS